ncbi:DUF3592 domain-containing protein [Streptomyces sp. XD-27]|uniref:DUF3592 domain-containing protein n=1 Tax=Streptomyces sp. XD-27 TaxID=3062779 RepID=UPI0026F423B0|nr:DUF3592 domain-containing protein [Streptomyces sp. XD-27]WKX68764.1 DUF3592 domain-containing protein [Streptomyces sp. XD-27]
MSHSAVLWVFSLTFTPMGAVIGVAAYLKVRQIRRLVLTGIRAQGVVTRHEPTQMQGHGDATIIIRSSGTTVYFPVIAWTTADNRPMETRSDIARPLDETLAIGARVEVRYDPADPSRWTLPAESNSLWWLAVGLGALFAVIGLGFFFGALFSQV